MGRDLGTYHLRVELADGRGYIQKWETGRRFSEGTDSTHPLTAFQIEPTWESEDELFGTMLYMYRDGNYSCDCNKTLFLCRAAQEDEPEDIECRDTLIVSRITVIRPDGSTEVILEELPPNTGPSHDRD